MKNPTKKSTIQKILFVIIILLLVNFTLVPYVSYGADDDDSGWSLAGSLAKELMQLLSWFGDVIMGGLNNFMLGANGFGSAMLSTEDPNLRNPDSWLYADYNSVDSNDEKTFEFKDGVIDTSSFLPGTKFEVPNMLYSPDNIFANNIAALDINFLRENTFQSIYVGGSEKFEKNAREKSISSVNKLRETIASWYKSFRNIAIVGLLSVLIYLGIRILISSTAADKAKYKENLKDWVVALCLIFVIHFIMSAVLMVTDKCTELFSTAINEGYTVKVEGENVAFKTNLMGLVRFQAQAKDATMAATYTIIYIALVIYTCIFTFMYFKRFLYMAFFTMIAPLVALTYPIDRAGDGKSQAFNLWFKEYTMNAIIQPVHLILYTVFVASANELASNNPIYALVAIAFLIPAEKFIKKMFGLDKAESTSGFGAFAGGALAMSGLKQLAGIGPKGKKEKSEKGVKDEGTLDKGLFTPNNGLAGSFNTFGAGGDENNQLPLGNNQPIIDKDTENDDERKKDLYENSRNMAQAGLDEAKAEGFAPGDAEYDKYQNEIDKYNALLGGNQNDNPANPYNPFNPLNSSSSVVTNTNTGGKKRSVIRGAAGFVGRGVKAGGKQIWKRGGKVSRAGMRVAGAVAGGTIGLAAGLTTGDFSKTMQYMGAGALAGNAIGVNTQRAAVSLASGVASGVASTPEKLSEMGNGLARAWNEEMHGYYDYAGEEKARRQRQNEKARKTFLRDDKEKLKYRELASDLNMTNKGDLEKLMNAAADYKEAGITDDKLIQNSLKAEYNRDGSINGKSHNQFVDVATFAHKNGFGKDYIDDDKKRGSLENIIANTSSVKNNPNAQREVAQTFAEIFDRGSMYKTVGKLGRAPQSKPTTTK